MNPNIRLKNASYADIKLGKYSHIKKATAGKEMLLLKDRGEFRKIFVPSVEVTESALLVTKKKFMTFQPKTQADLKEIARAREEKLIQDQQKSNQRKLDLQKVTITNQAANREVQKSQEMETEKREYILDRAKELIDERQEEIQKLNSMILATKVGLIRKAQLEEKKLIKREIEEESLRLDAIMKDKMDKQFLEEKKLREVEKKKMQLFITTQTQQMKEASILKLMALQLKGEESRSINKAVIQLQNEEINREKQKQIYKEKVIEDMRLGQIEKNKFESRRMAEEKLADKRLIEYQEMKAKREAELEKQREEIKAAKAQEIARIGASQKRMADLKQQLIEQTAYIVQEEKEREYRRKEKESAQKRRDVEEALRISRELQIEDTRKRQVLQIELDKIAFHKVAQSQQLILNSVHERQIEQRKVAVENRKYILKQVEEKERERLRLRKEAMDEGRTIRLEMDLREKSIDNAFKRKIQSLKDVNFPEHGLNDIQRNYNLHIKSRHTN